MERYRSEDQLVSLIRQAAGSSKHIRLNYVWEHKGDTERAYIQLLTYEEPEVREAPTRKTSAALASRQDGQVDELRAELSELMAELGYERPEKSEQAVRLGYVPIRMDSDSARPILAKEAKYLHDLVQRKTGLDISITAYYLMGDTASKLHTPKRYRNILG